jgi:hypothetical protein
MVMKSPDDNSSTPAKTRDKILKQNEWISPRIKKGYGIYKSKQLHKGHDKPPQHNHQPASQSAQKANPHDCSNQSKLKKLMNQKNLLAILLHLGHLA